MPILIISLHLFLLYHKIATKLLIFVLPLQKTQTTNYQVMHDAHALHNL